MRQTPKSLPDDELRTILDDSNHDEIVEGLASPCSGRRLRRRRTNEVPPRGISLFRPVRGAVARPLRAGRLTSSYGVNEAGKSSALRGLNALLFGFPGQSSDDFRFKYNQFRVHAVLENQAGQKLECFGEKATRTPYAEAATRKWSRTGNSPNSSAGWTGISSSSCSAWTRSGWSLEEGTSVRRGRRAVSLVKSIGGARCRHEGASHSVAKMDKQQKRTVSSQAGGIRRSPRRCGNFANRNRPAISLDPETYATPTPRRESERESYTSDR